MALTRLTLSNFETVLVQISCATYFFKIFSIYSVLKERLNAFAIWIFKVFKYHPYNTINSNSPHTVSGLSEYDRPRLLLQCDVFYLLLRIIITIIVTIVFTFIEPLLLIRKRLFYVPSSKPTEVHLAFRCLGCIKTKVSFENWTSLNSFSSLYI